MKTPEQLFQEVIAIQINEICDRTRRTETNLYKIREHLGLEAPNGARQVEVIDENTVKVQGYDVTISKIKQALKSVGKYTPGHLVDVVLEDCTISEIRIYD